MFQGHAWMMTNEDWWSCWVVRPLPLIILLFSHPCWWPINTFTSNWWQVSHKLGIYSNLVYLWYTICGPFSSHPTGASGPGDSHPGGIKQWHLEKMEDGKNQTKNGRNPAPVVMVNIPLFTGFDISQVVFSPDFWTINSICIIISRYFWADPFLQVGYLSFQETIQNFVATFNHFRFIHLHTKPRGRAFKNKHRAGSLVFKGGMNEGMKEGTKEWMKEGMNESVNEWLNDDVDWLLGYNFPLCFCSTSHTHYWQFFPSNSHRILDWLPSLRHTNKP